MREPRRLFLLVLWLSCLVYAPPLWGDQSAQAQNRAQNERRERRIQRFRGMDRNGDRVITRDEWRGSGRAFERHDVNRDGILSGTEIWPAGDDAEWEKRRRRAQRDNLLEQGFLRVDRNRDGVLSREEWSNDPKRFDVADTDHNGFVTRTEYFAGGWVGDSRIDSPAPSRRDSRAFQAGYDRGLQDGRQAGKEDKELRNQWDLEGQRELEQADGGYDASMGVKAEYQAGYRAGFRAGYQQGFGPRAF